MTNWYSITPSSPLTIGNLTPVGQNSGQVGCRWPPNGHHLAACLKLDKKNQLWGPFWYRGGNEFYVTLPLTVYTVVKGKQSSEQLPKNMYRLVWDDTTGMWSKQPEHQKEEIEIIGGCYLINTQALRNFWQSGKVANNPCLVKMPWETLTLSHNSRENFQVKDEGGFFAEMTTLLEPGWSILVKIIGDAEETPKLSTLGAGGTPVVIKPVNSPKSWEQIGEKKENAIGAILLTGALWQKGTQPISLPYPYSKVKAYGAEEPIPWQSWKKVRDRKEPNNSDNKVKVLTPGEWLTPPGAVYLWQEATTGQSGPFPDPFHRDALGYGHLWLF